MNSKRFAFLVLVAFSLSILTLGQPFSLFSSVFLSNSLYPPKIPIPNCPIRSCRYSGITVQSLPSSLTENKTVLSNIGTNCSGFFITATDNIERSTLSATLIELAVDTGEIIQTQQYIGHGHLLICPHSEGIFLVNPSSGLPVNITWYLLPATLSTSGATFQLNTSMTATFNYSTTLPPLPLTFSNGSVGSTIFTLLLVHVQGIRPRFSSIPIFETNVPSLSYGSGGSETFAFFAIPSNSVSLSFVRDLGDLIRARILSEKSSITNIYTISSQDQYQIVTVPSGTNVGWLNCPLQGQLVSVIPLSLLSGGSVLYSPNITDGSECLLQVGLNAYVDWSSSAPVGLSLLSEVNIVRSSLRSGKELSNNFYSYVTALAGASSANTCYHPVVLSSSSGTVPVNWNYTACETMIRWPCSYDSDCQSPISGSTNCDISVSLCNFTVNQILNCIVASLPTSVANYYGTGAYNYFFSKYSTVIASYSPPLYTKLDNNCIDGYWTGAQYSAKYLTSCERDVIISSGLRQCYDEVCAPTTGGNCVYNNGLELVAAESCSNYCNVQGGLYNYYYCQLSIAAVNNSCTSANVITGTAPCPPITYMACSLADEIYFSPHIGGSFSSSCVSYDSLGFTNVVTSPITSYIGEYFPPRFAYPFISSNASIFSLPIAAGFNWDGLFAELAGPVSGTGGADQWLLTRVNNYYLPLVYSSVPPGTIISDTQFYWVYYGYSVATQSFNLSSSVAFDLYLSPSLSSISIVVASPSVVTFCFVSLDLCSNYSITSSMIIPVVPSLGSQCYNGLWTDAEIITFGQTLNACRSTTYNNSLISFGSLSICSSISLTIVGDLTVNTGDLQLQNGNLSIGGSLVLNGATLLFGGSMSLINVTGCLNISNSSISTLSPIVLGTNYTIIQHSGCISGNFSVANGGDPCTSPTAQLEYQSTSIILSFVSNPNCSSSSVINTNYPLIGGLVAAIVVVLGVAIIVIFIKVKAVRKAIAPYHDRQRHVMQPRR